MAGEQNSPTFQIVLLEPEIAPNAGNVARLCAAARAVLHLIEPFGFRLEDKDLKRAGMDYWQTLEWRRWPNWKTFSESLPADAKLWMVESHGPKHYGEVRFTPGDYILFGRETAGLPSALLEQHREEWIRIPMFNAKARSLNLSNCAALVLYEALRQNGFAGEIGKEMRKDE